MSLFNNIQTALKANGFDMGFGSSINNKIAGNIGLIVDKYIPKQIERAINTGAAVLSDIEGGNFVGAAGRVAGLLGINGGETASNMLYFNTPTPMFGGVTPLEALEIYNTMRGNTWCRKNLWILEVESNLTGDDSEKFNMFAYNLEFSPVTITGEKKQIGAAHVDLVNSADPVELTMTTMDNDSGFIKLWFEQHGAACASSDGTVGLPADYAIKIKVIHGFISKARGGSGGYKSEGLYRVGNMSLSLSRSEQSLSEITMTFVQLDTFMS